MSLKRSSEFLMMLFLWKKCYTGSRVCDVVFVKEMLHRFEVCKFRPDGSRALLSPFINVQLMITRHSFKKKMFSTRFKMRTNFNEWNESKERKTRINDLEGWMKIAQNKTNGLINAEWWKSKECVDGDDIGWIQKISRKTINRIRRATNKWGKRNHISQQYLVPRSNSRQFYLKEYRSRINFNRK
jgi:hypothetical protein